MVFIQMTNIIDRTIAKSTFETGPAAAILRTSVLGFLRFCSLNSTGLAQPNPAMSRMIKPRGSICFSGFRVIRPWSLDVVSPHL
jgi:hypothetical protein